MRPGDDVTVRGADERLVRTKVVGLYAAGDRSPAVWASLSSTFGTPDSVAVAAREAFAGSRGLAGDAAALWLGVPEAGGLRLGDIGALQDRAKRFAGSDASLSVLRGGGGPPGDDIIVSAGLRRALDRLTAPIAVARAGLYVPATLLATLAATALVLTARQLAEHRRPELALLAARGRAPGGSSCRRPGSGPAWPCPPGGRALPRRTAAARARRGRARRGRGAGPAATGLGWAAALAAVAAHGAALLLPTARVVRTGGR
ncbi:hypothetical protein [Streptomyces sp. 135]|uniref:hypothetical protein n=1 Tax=Streptomyces sp. 135 TaxID=2838850 RepID=UPI001CC037C0|nr:hypothetical protein [Streptomyces sp. 135]